MLQPLCNHAATTSPNTLPTPRTLPTPYITQNLTNTAHLAPYRHEPTPYLHLHHILPHTYTLPMRYTYLHLAYVALKHHCTCPLHTFLRCTPPGRPGVAPSATHILAAHPSRPSGGCSFRYIYHWTTLCPGNPVPWQPCAFYHWTTLCPGNPVPWQPCAFYHWTTLCPGNPVPFITGQPCVRATLCPSL